MSHIVGAVTLVRYPQKALHSFGCTSYAVLVQPYIYVYIYMYIYICIYIYIYIYIYISIYIYAYIYIQ